MVLSEFIRLLLHYCGLAAKELTCVFQSRRDCTRGPVIGFVASFWVSFCATFKTPYFRICFPITWVAFVFFGSGWVNWLFYRFLRPTSLLFLVALTCLRFIRFKRRRFGFGRRLLAFGNMYSFFLQIVVVLYSFTGSRAFYFNFRGALGYISYYSTEGQCVYFVYIYVSSFHIQLFQLRLSDKSFKLKDKTER